MTPLLRITVVLAIVCLGAGAKAQDVNQHRIPTAGDGVQVGVGVICNSSDQVKRYLTVKSDKHSIEDAILRVNHEARDDRACGMAMVAFVAGGEAGKVDVTDGKMHVRQITILAVAIDGAWQRIPDTVQYTAFLEKLENV